jgi:hypothetical protein
MATVWRRFMSAADYACCDGRSLNFSPSLNSSPFYSPPPHLHIQIGSSAAVGRSFMFLVPSIAVGLF